MSPSENKKQRKELLSQKSQSQREIFEKSLPLPRHTFHSLFDYLDKKLVECDDSLKLTEIFLSENYLDNVKQTLDWLKEHGAYCDCEVLANVEEQFD